MNEISAESGTERPQSTLGTLLMVTAVVVVLIGLVTVATRNYGELLDTVMDHPAIYAIGCAFLALTGFTIMLVNVALNRVASLWSAGLLLSGIAFAAANAAIFIVMILVNAFAIFEPIYINAIVLIAPTLMIIASMIVAGVYKKINWLGVLGFVLWTWSVGLAHLWIIAAASASV